MAQFETCFRLFIAFYILVYTDVTPATAEHNLTHIQLLSVRQGAQQHKQWESPVNHAWKTNSIADGVKMGNSQGPLLAAFAEPSGGLIKQMPQHLQTNNDVADTISSSVLRFAINVGSELSENAHFSKSEVFSPLSIMSALALLFAGARGRSYQQLKPVFGYDLNTALSKNPNYAAMLHQEFGLLLQDIEQENVGAMHRRQNAKWRNTPERANIRSQAPNQKPIVHIIKVTNGLFAQNGYNLNPNYKEVIKTIYKSELMQLDFQNDTEAARHHINSWVDKNTFGKIKNVINNAIPKDTNMILASVLYFKGFWENTFFEEATILDNFYPEGEGRPAIKVQMMATGGVFPYYESPEYDCRIIGLPYRGNLSTMYIIQPRQSSRTKLKDFQSKITPEAIEDMISKMAYHSAVMAFPKLHLVRQLNLKEILQHFGISDIFSRTTSDLSLIGGSKPNQNASIASVAKLMEISRAPSRPWRGQQLHTIERRPVLMDRFNEAPLFFSSRFGGSGNSSNSSDIINQTTIVQKDLVAASKMATNQTSAKLRKKRQTMTDIRYLNLLEEERFAVTSSQSDLYVEDILHKVDFEVNEHGTEAAAATLTYLRRSGTDVVFRCDTPFMLLLRHDPSKLVLFYATVNEPEI